MTFGSKTTGKSLWLWIPSIYFAQCMFVWWLHYTMNRNVNFGLVFVWGEILYTKGQLISKANCQAVNSSKKRTNEFVFTTMRHVFVRCLEEIEVNKKTFRN